MCKCEGTPSFHLHYACNCSIKLRKGENDPVLKHHAMGAKDRAEVKLNTF